MIQLCHDIGQERYKSYWKLYDAIIPELAVWIISPAALTMKNIID